MAKTRKGIPTPLSQEQKAEQERRERAERVAEKERNETRENLLVRVCTRLKVLRERSSKLRHDLKTTRLQLSIRRAQNKELTEQNEKLREQVERLSKPIPMLLYCPLCGGKHIDEGEFARQPHKTHACQFCGFIWSQAAVATVGVQFIPGYRNQEKPK